MSANQRQTDFLAKVGELSRGIIERAFSGKASALQAIKAKCLDCCHFDRDEVANCQTVLCPLHEYRPYAETELSERRRNAHVRVGARPIRHPSGLTPVGKG